MAMTGGGDHPTPPVTARTTPVSFPPAGPGAGAGAGAGPGALNTMGGGPGAPPPAPQSGFKPPGQQMQQQHAISYVTTIRNRFANEPDTYRSFLKILHTYQKEQKGIKDVLEQVR